MEKSRQPWKAVRTALDIKDVVGLIWRLVISGGASAAMTGGISQYNQQISGQALILYIIGFTLLFIALIPQIVSLFNFLTKGKQVIELTEPELPIIVHPILTADNVEVGINTTKEEIVGGTLQHNILGTFDKIIIDVFPGRFSFYAFSRMDFRDPERTNFKNRYIITDKKGSVISFTLWSDISIASGYPGQTLRGLFENVEFQYPGTYYVCLELDDQKNVAIVARAPILVVKKQTSAETRPTD